MYLEDEQFVVYLFSIFHRELGFEHIVQIQTKFPDCIAVRGGKQVSIEFENTSDSLVMHLEGKLVYPLPGHEVNETDTEIIIREGSEIRVYPKSEYRLFPGKQLNIIRKKLLKLDYCVCWKINHDSSLFKEEYSEIKEFIELSSNPKIIDFMGKRKKSLESLGIKNLAAEETPL